MAVAAVISVFGSPPRLRGIQPDEPGHLTLDRFTPAPAGNTDPERVPSPSWSVHPRACGEYAVRSLRPEGCGGSPPRLRGIHDTGTFERRDSTVHPRACGEYEFALHIESPAIGSPPRLRGIRVAIATAAL